MKTKKKAISLIVLVVTIIVLAILAATVIVTITNSGIINRATDTVKEYDLSEVRSLANLVWAEALMDENVRTDAEYDAYVKQQLTNAGVNIGDYNIGATSSGVLVTLRGNQNETELANITITTDTEGVTFIPVDGAEVTNERLTNLQTGDIVQYGDYEYRYNMRKDSDYGLWWMEKMDSEIDGWGVSILAASIDKTTLSQLCDTIYDQPIVDMGMAFGIGEETGRDPIVKASALTVAPQIPSGVTYMKGTFKNCTNLKEAPQIPSGVTNMNGTFQNCTSLAEAPVILSSVTDMYSTFSGCTSLAEAPVMPSSVTDMNYTFSNCTNLKEAPEIPSSVTRMGYTFYGCTSLTGELKINSELVSNMQRCFYSLTNKLTVKVPADSTTYTTITTADLGSNSITIETFVPETVTP